MQIVKEAVLKMIRRKQIEIVGRDPESLHEKIQEISNPVLRKKLVLLDKKYQGMKIQIGNVS